MNKFCSLLRLLLVLPGSLSQCNFRDETLFDGTFDIEETSTGNDYGIFEHAKRKLYVWKNHRVHFMYHASMSESDKKVARELLAPVIDMYGEKTCVVFREYTTVKGIPEHHLIINVTFKKPDCYNNGYVKTESNKNNMLMMLELSEGVTREDCKITMEPLIYHEMGHAMGIAHTHKRDDRDQYVIYNDKCAKDDEKHNFEIIKNDTRNIKLAYECNSIMHYKRNTWNKDDCSNNCQCNVLSPKPGSNCTTIEPSEMPTELDWQLINMAQNCPGY